jgi:hypothetical protein
MNPKLQKLTKNIFILIIPMFFGVILLQACYREPKFPDAALNKEKMTAILADIHLAEAKLAGMGNNSQAQRDSTAEVYYATIFKIHKVKAEDFNSSMEAYMQNPKALSEIYEKVLEKLQKEQSANLKKK